MSKLRYGFLPSDFHPMVLILGEAAELRRFSDLLASFAENPVDTKFETVEFLQAADDTKIRLVSSGSERGMRQEGPKSHSLIWTIDSWQAEEFADQVAELCQPGLKSGSEFLEAAVGEIRVKVSLGEYTEDFLM